MAPPVAVAAAALAGLGLTAAALDSRYGFSKDLFQMRYTAKTAEWLVSGLDGRTGLWATDFSRRPEERCDATRRDLDA